MIDEIGNQISVQKSQPSYLNTLENQKDYSKYDILDKSKSNLDYEK